MKRKVFHFSTNYPHISTIIYDHWPCDMENVKSPGTVVLEESMTDIFAIWLSGGPTRKYGPDDRGSERPGGISR